MAWFIVATRSGLGCTLPKPFVDQLARLGAKRGAGATWVVPSRRGAGDLHDRLALLLGEGDGLLVADADHDGCCGPSFNAASDARTSEPRDSADAGGRVIDLSAHRRRPDE